MQDGSGSPKYTINKLLRGVDFDAAVTKTREALSAKGFRILTEIDVKATLKKKLDVKVDDYLILGACKPHHGARSTHVGAAGRRHAPMQRDFAKSGGT